MYTIHYYTHTTLCTILYLSYLVCIIILSMYTLHTLLLHYLSTLVQQLCTTQHTYCTMYCDTHLSIYISTHTLYYTHTMTNRLVYQVGRGNTHSEQVGRARAPGRQAAAQSRRDARAHNNTNTITTTHTMIHTYILYTILIVYTYILYHTTILHTVGGQYYLLHYTPIPTSILLYYWCTILHYTPRSTVIQRATQGRRRMWLALVCHNRGLPQKVFAKLC